MAAAFSASIFSSTVYENLVEYEPFLQSDEPFVILGRTYDLPRDREELEEDVRSKLWFTYRKNFSAIGGTGPTSDVGWGCMLRCGQMMVAQSLVNLHLQRDWRWKSGCKDLKYFEILKLFQDRKDCCYSIQQIASMGASEGKKVGEWFGPNTVVQVLRKLAPYDRWSDLVIQVAMDNSVIIEDICKLCETSEKIESSSSNSLILSKLQSKTATVSPQKYKNKKVEHDIVNGSPGQEALPRKDGSPGEDGLPGKDGSPGKDRKTAKQEDDRSQETGKTSASSKGWRPLLLVIPLRLGLSDINATYFDGVKACFQLKQSVGIIGGKPSHAHWFIGYAGNRLFYLDPHTVQPFVDLSKKDEDDESFHCHHPCFMDISELDPSIAVGFFCKSKDDFDDLCQNINKSILTGVKTPMFELHEKRPAHFPPIQPYCLDRISKQSSSARDKQQTDTDDEFEIL